MRRRKTAVVVVAILVCTGIRLDHGIAATYCVDSGHGSASDTNPGTETLPWLTLQHGAHVAVAGDTVIVKAGSYTDVSFATSGTADAWVTFRGVSTSDVVIQGAMEFVAGTAYIHVSHFTVENYPVWGVFLRGNNRYITLDDLHIAGGGAGIHLTYGYQAEDPLEGPVSDITIENSLIEDCTYTGIDCTPGPCDRLLFRNLEVRDMGIEVSWGADGIAVERGQDILVEDCYVHDNAGDGIDLNSRDFDGHVDGISVRRNRVVRNHSNGIKLWAGGRMENNLIWGQGNTPVMLGAFPGTFEIVNNTIAYNMWDPEFSVRNYAFLVAYPNDETHISAQVDLTLVNNIFAFNGHDDLGGPTGLYLGEGVTLVGEGHNVYWSRVDGEIQADFLPGGQWFSRQMIADGTWASATGQGTGEVTSDPEFISSWPDADLHLQSGSPAINTGQIVEGLGTDVDGNARPSGNAYDIGAYEYQEEVSPPTASFSATPRTGSGMTCLVQFTDQSYGEITSWSWSFGDGETSVEQNSSHVYDCNGPFTVSLTVSGPRGSDSETKTDYIGCDCPCGISITSPGGEEIWCSGEEQELDWTSQYTNGTVKIEYSMDGGLTWHAMAASTPDDGSYDWIVPNASSPECLVRICDTATADCCAESEGTFRICECEEMEISTPGIMGGTVGCPLEQRLQAGGGCSPYTWSILKGKLPDGVTLDVSSGHLYGVPTDTGNYRCTIQIKDIMEHEASREYSVRVEEYEQHKGDVNADCRTDVLDVVMVINFILEIAQPTSEQGWRADCNDMSGQCHGNGVINIMDALKIVHLILGTDACP